MKYTTCSNCNKHDIPFNGTIKVDLKTLCADCFGSAYPDRKSLEGKTVEKQVDPTICADCGKDYGSIVLEKHSRYHICESCNEKLKERIFPIWVKGFFAFIIVIVIFSFCWNWRFYQAFSEIKQASQSFGTGNYIKADSLMGLASEKVPEVEDIKTLSHYYKAAAFLSIDSSNKALDEFYKCQNSLPESYKVDSLIIQTRISATFDNKDYDGFLAASLDAYQYDSTSAISAASVASAYACLYASKGADSAKILGEEYLNRSKEIDSTSKDAKDYDGRIAYRLYSRRIITSDEYYKRFPNGWSKN